MESRPSVKPDSVTVRTARAEDVDESTGVHLRSWRAAYRGLLPDDYLDTLDVDGRRNRWELCVGSPQREEWTLVAGLGLEMAGVASVGRSLHGDATPETGHLDALYVDPAHWGKGVGRLLQREALDRLAAAGFAVATLWVLVGNERARRFYEATGWTADGTTKVEERPGVTLEQMRYSRGLRIRREGGADADR